MWWGDFAAAASLIAEADAVVEATGSYIAPSAAMRLAAFRGREAEAASLIRATIEQAAGRGQGASLTSAHWVAAVLYNGLSRYEEAVAAARQATGHRLVNLSMWALSELVEAAARTGNTQLASQALEQLAEWTQAGGTDWGLGVEARSRALLNDGEQADRLYREAITRLGHTRMRPDLARAHLLYGEWLRRQQRPTDARTAAHRLPDARRHRHGRLRRAGPPRAARHRRDHPQAPRHCQRRADTPGGADRPAGGRRAVEPGDRHLAVPVPAHRPVPPGQGLHQAAHHLPRRTGPRPVRPLSQRAVGVTAGHQCWPASRFERRSPGAFRSIVYFGGLGVGTDVLKLLGWLAVGIVLLGLGWFKLRHGRHEVTSATTGSGETG